MAHRLIFAFSLLLFLGVGSVCTDSAAAGPQPLRITRITPEGEDVPAGRQIVIQFNRAVVPIGPMGRDASEIPVEITPSLDCRWQWLNTSALACQLDHDKAMAPATAYQLTVDPGIYAEDGATLEAPHSHAFITERPDVRRADFDQWQGPGSPVIRLTFNQPVSRDSVEQHLYFRLPEAKKPVRLSLRARPDPNDGDRPRFILSPEPKMRLLDSGEREAVEADDQPVKTSAGTARRIWLVEPVRPLSLDQAVELKVEPGLVSALGQEAGVAERVVVAFHSFPEFRFLGVRCRTLKDKQVLIAPEQEPDKSRCDPVAGTALVFSAPVLNEEVKRYVKITPDLAGGRKDYDPWENMGNYSRLHQPHEKDKTYEIWLPAILKAAKTYEIVIPEAGGLDKLKALIGRKRLPQLQDEFGRTLPAAVKMRFQTDHRRPTYVMAHRTAVIEQGIDSEVPLYVTNLEQVKVDFQRLTATGRQQGLSKTLSVPDAKDISFAIPLKVREMLEGRSGVLYGTLSTIPAIKKSKRERTLYSQVTPYALHVKIGHFNTLVWVTDLNTGQPVDGAKVSVYRDSVNSLNPAPQVIAEGRTDGDGLAQFGGTEKLDPRLETFGWRCYGDHCPRLFVRVDRGGEMVLMPLEQRFVVDTWRASDRDVYSNLQKRYGHIHSWGTTAQGVYRAGDTVQYKIYVRNQANERYVPAPEKSYTLILFDPTGTKVHERKEIQLDGFGAFDGEIPIAETGAVGWYRFHLQADFTDHQWSPMQVLVSDFTPSPFRVHTDLSGDRFRTGQAVEVASAARLHSGGGYRDAEVRVTAVLKEKNFSSDHSRARGFRFDTWRGQPQKTLFQETGLVDDKGEKTSRFTLLPGDILYGSLTVESAVRDDRGKYVAASRNADFVGADRFVGLKSDRWLYQQGQPAEIHYLVVDGEGAPAAGTDVAVKIERLETKAARVKGAGNAYLTHFVEQWRPAGECRSTSTTEPAPCRFTPEVPGSYRLTARITDSRGVAQSTEMRIWVAGKGQVVWNLPDDNSLAVEAEKNQYRIGETARYLIRNPFPGARALVSVERYGVLRRWIHTLEGSTPVIEFPVEADMMPGFYLSVTVMSPRVEAPPPEGVVDLGKPAFRMGYASAEVKDPYKQMRVSVTTERDTYKPREKVRAKLHAEPVAGGDRSEPIQLAVAVLDEAVFDLISGGKGYYDPYGGFYRLDGLDLANYNLLTQLVGRQKFEKKGATAAGDGGANLAMRTLFKFVSYWNPAIDTDANGDAEIEFEVPDNLTGWRILALAVTPTDRMGLGDTSFKVNRPTELRPVMPNQVTEGDEFSAGFSVMNRTDQRRTLTVILDAEGDIDADKMGLPFSRDVVLEPFQRKTVWLPVRTTAVAARRDVRQGQVRFSASAEDDLDGDALGHAVPVNKRRALQTAANYGSTTESKVEERLLFPKRIRSDVGDVSVVLSPSVIGNVEGAFRYLRDYPYTCWEQILSKGVMAVHYQNLKGYLPEDLEWPEAQTLPDKILKQASAYQAPNGGMAFYIPRDLYVSPYLSAYTALAFNWLRAGGHKIPPVVEEKLHAYLDNLLRQDAMPDFYSKGMASAVRAVALAALAERGKLARQDLERYRPHIPLMDLFGKAHFLQAALAVEGARDIAAETEKAILAASVQSSGKLLFNEELDDSYSRILATPLRTNCAILSALLGHQGAAGRTEAAGEIPSRMVRAITQTRGNRDHWENTQENLFCMNALVDYSRVYEKTPPVMAVTVKLDDEPFGTARFKDLRDGAVTLSRPIEEGDPGRSAAVVIERDGKGRFYHASRLTYAPLEEASERINAGIDIRREYNVEREGKWILLEKGAEIRRGELVRVDIFVALPTARHFVVVDDPVPGGLEPLSRDLATTSEVDAGKGSFKAAGGSWWYQFGDWQEYGVSRWNFYHQELRHDAVRFYSDYLPAGRYHLSYAAQAVAAGRFARLPVHAEEMYDPDVYGKGLPSSLEVKKNKPESEKRGSR